MSTKTSTDLGSSNEPLRRTDESHGEKPDEPSFFMTCPKGFERLLADELASLGIAHLRALHGQVSFQGALEDSYRACMWSRLGSRVVLVLSRVSASTADELYDGLSHIGWEDHVSLGSTIAVDAHGTNEQLKNTKFVAQHAKDAIVDRLLAQRGARPAVDLRNPDITVVVRISRDHATVGIDLSGTPLFRRGYETARSSRSPIAPLRPDYAAALLATGGWYKNVRDGHENPTLACLYGGAGTLLVEAAAQALNRAPGLMRGRWGFERWLGHDATAWDKVEKDARDAAKRAAEHTVTLLAYDPRSGAEATTRQALRTAGMDVAPTFGSPAELASALTGARNALLACDLSWIEEGEAAQEALALARVSEVAGAYAGGEAAGESIAVLSPDTSVDFALGCKPASTTGVLIGQRAATMRAYEVSALPESRPTIAVTLPGGRRAETPVLVEASDQFAARLAKVAKTRAKWAASEDVTCYRIYDADLPDYAVTIDLFEGSVTPGRWLSISEYAAPKGVDPELARRRLLDVLSITPQVMGVDPACVSLRVRRRAKGGSQYADEGSHEGGSRARRARPGHVELPPHAHLVDEGGLTFEVNFSERLDCGLFLDHRETRSMIRELMKKTPGGSFLNLFAYTGTATCYAADGGAGHTTTVDLSKPSLDWARRNMERNGFVGRDHEFVQADVLRWVGEQRRDKKHWDLIFCDVPTFSNSSRMRSRGWDVQRDHVELIISLSRLLKRDGRAIFSCNLRSFKPDVETLEKAGVGLEDITAQTIPDDFSRNPRIHRCYLVTRPNVQLGVR